MNFRYFPLAVALIAAPSIMWGGISIIEFNPTPPSALFLLTGWFALAAWIASCIAAARVLYTYDSHFVSTFLVAAALGLCADAVVGAIIAHHNTGWLFRLAMAPWTAITIYAAYLLLRLRPLPAVSPIPVTPLLPSPAALNSEPAVMLTVDDVGANVPAALPRASRPAALPSTKHPSGTELVPVASSTGLLIRKG